MHRAPLLWLKRDSMQMLVRYKGGKAKRLPSRGCFPDAATKKLIRQHRFIAACIRRKALSLFQPTRVTPIRLSLTHPPNAAIRPMGDSQGM